MPSNCPFSAYSQVFAFSPVRFRGAISRKKKKGVGIRGVNMGWTIFEVFFLLPMYPELSKFWIYEIKSVCIFQPLILSFLV
jgi:hypothetical protein